MDNQNFEQQFTQNVKSTAAQPVSIESGASSRLPLIISAVLAAIVLVESIALIIMISNYSIANNEYFSEDTTEIESEDGDDNAFVYDEDGNITAMEIICTNESGGKITLNKSNKLEISDANSTLIDSGNYTVVRDSIISFTGSGNDRYLYYDGIFLADDTVIYDCEETINEEITE
jgi:hypothetical protein